MQKGAAAPPRGGDAVRQHRHDGVEIFVREVAIGIGAAAHRVQIVERPFARRRRRDDLLRENIERGVRHAQRVHRAAANRAHEGRAFEQFVARRREETAFRAGADPVS